ncbi:MAG TPA: hypothetical protein VFW71_04255 [Actinomycetota bacterium]|nr:hypothetical protein [Actinomycetota bacterium]
MPERTSPVLTPEIGTFVEAILVDDKAPRKQRHTARRIWQRVADELDSPVAESTVRALVAERLREPGIGQRAFVPQHLKSAAEADYYEADFQQTIEPVA